jgi:DNA-binding MarR family transcriptional regulator
MADQTKEEALGALILEIFRVNGRLLSHGDRLVAGLNLTSARWQVLGAVVRAPGGETVSGVARLIGLRRQGVQRIVNELVEEDMLVSCRNPHHRRAPLVLPTANGLSRYEAAMRLREPWARNLSSDLSHERIAVAASVLTELRIKLEASTEGLVSKFEDDGSDA